MKTEFKLRKVVYEGIEFDNYKFNMETNEVIGPRGRALKLFMSWGYYNVRLYKDEKQHCILLHRLVYQMHNKDEDIKGFFIDHKDRNPLNNHIDNLRKATIGENCQNRAPRGKSKYIGVNWRKHAQKWRVAYRDGSMKHIGYYMSEIEAAHAYDETILRLELNNGFRPLNRNLYPDDFKFFKNTKENILFNKMVKRKKVIHVVQAEPEPVQAEPDEPENVQVDPVKIEIKQVDPDAIEVIQKNKEVTIEEPEKIQEIEHTQEANEPKKGRGRPKKEKQVPTEPVEKPKRGRPRKEKPENPEPREKQKRGPKPTDKGRVALGVNGYGKVYYKENAYDINRKRLIREIEKGYEPTDKMLIKYNIT
jgi:hypothetical protein